MVKTYTSQDNTFEGTITFDNAIDMDSNKITNVDTPTSDSDLANKSYVDADIIYPITSEGTGTGSFDGDDSTKNVASVTVTVASGQYVLLLVHGKLIGMDNGEDAEFYIKRSGTKITPTGYEINSEIEDATNHDIAFTLNQVDYESGTGSVTYDVYGYTDSDYTCYVTINAIVFNTV